MKELLEFLARALVEDPDEVRVIEREDDMGAVLELRVAQGDMGRVIGKQGKIAKAMRTIVKSVASRKGEHVFIEIKDDE